MDGMFIKQSASIIVLVIDCSVVKFDDQSSLLCLKPSNPFLCYWRGSSADAVYFWDSLNV